MFLWVSCPIFRARFFTNGGPGYASSTFTLYTINTAFTYNNFGLASAMAVAIMLLVVGVYLIQNVVITRMRKRGAGRNGG